jgi:uncharacterized protein YbbC (DUF1343 family)
MNKILLLCFILCVGLTNAIGQSPIIHTGAEQMNDYLPLLNDKKVALLVNQTSMVDQTHLVDSLLSRGIHIEKIFAPEHGFRGTGDAGEHIENGIDARTGLTITSMYGANKKPSKESMQGIDIVVFDIQDVGARFYTYISSLQYMMEACAESDIPLLILDRPNPNGFYVDGPVMENAYKSFVGMQSIPIVHGMTVGEYAQMLNGEHWLSNAKTCNLTVIPCTNYTHNTKYQLPVPPSPNLKSPTAIYFYPSLCLFEGTKVSIGRGTSTPFELWGHPDFKTKSFSFTPISAAGAKKPALMNQICFGQNLNMSPEDALTLLNGKINLAYIIEAYSLTAQKDSFFSPFFEKLTGTNTLRKQIQDGIPEATIRKSWEPGLTKFKAIRKKYLLYKDAQ